MNNNQTRIQGSIVAIVTPMHGDCSLDTSAIDRLVEFHCDQGTNAIVAVGTTGESATLSFHEHLSVVEYMVERVAGRIPVIAGTGANSTDEAIELTCAAKELGVDACLLVVPYYNKPTQEGLFQHYMAIADRVDVPQILYNVPGRTVTDMSNDVVLRLALHPNIIGIKDATADMDRGRDLIARAPEGFTVYSGDDFTAPELMLMGAKGNISVTANVAPAQMSQLCQLAMSGQQQPTRTLQEALMPLHNALFNEANPIPVKWAVSAMGLMSGGIRLPLTPLTAANIELLKSAMETPGLDLFADP